MIPPDPAELSRWKPKLAVTLSSPEQAMSLFERLSVFPGEKGIFRGEDGVPRPDRFQIGLHEFPDTPEELERALAVIRAWLRDEGLKTVAVRTAGVTQEVRQEEEM